MRNILSASFVVWNTSASGKAGCELALGLCDNYSTKAWWEIEAKFSTCQGDPQVPWLSSVGTIRVHGPEAANKFSFVYFSSC